MCVLVLLVLPKISADVLGCVNGNVRERVHCRQGGHGRKGEVDGAKPRVARSQQMRNAGIDANRCNCGENARKDAHSHGDAPRVSSDRTVSETQSWPYVNIDAGFARVRATVAEIHRSNRRIKTEEGAAADDRIVE